MRPLDAFPVQVCPRALKISQRWLKPRPRSTMNSEASMTHDPRLPTLEEVMNGNPFDIIDSPWGHIERWRASTLATGTMGVLANVYDIVRSDAAEATAR